MMRRILPVLLFVVLLATFGIGLSVGKRELPSPLLDRAAPAFVLPLLEGGGQLGSAELRGKPWVLNVWASWCSACRSEHETLMRFARDNAVPLYGLNYKDTDGAAKAWLAQHGNPYRATLVDADGRVGIDYGVYGVPETFLIDAEGRVRYKHVGPLDEKAVREEILPRLKSMGAA